VYELPYLHEITLYFDFVIVDASGYVYRIRNASGLNSMSYLSMVVAT